jgi:hypothetical protein
MTGKMVKLWSEAVTKSAAKSDDGKEKPNLTKLTRRTSAEIGTSVKKAAPMPQRTVRPASAAAAVLVGVKASTGGPGGERKSKRTNAEISPAGKSDPLPNLRKAAKGSPGFDALTKKSSGDAGLSFINLMYLVRSCNYC